MTRPLDTEAKPAPSPRPASVSLPRERGRGRRVAAGGGAAALVAAVAAVIIAGLPDAGTSPRVTPTVPVTRSAGPSPPGTSTSTSTSLSTSGSTSEGGATSPNVPATPPSVAVTGQTCSWQQEGDVADTASGALTCTLVDGAYRWVSSGG